MPNTAQRCAEQLISIVPRLMQTMREEMRAGRSSDLTVPQFRTLVFFHLHKGAALSQAAEHLGLGAPSASKLVEHLVLRGLLTRCVCAADRRKVAIALTDEGRDVLATASRAAAEAFARKLRSLSSTELDVLSAMLGSLEAVLGAQPASLMETASLTEPASLMETASSRAADSSGLAPPSPDA